MSYQERDIKKLRTYANSLGLRVHTRKYTRFTGSAEFDSKLKTITIFISSQTTKTDIILSLLHELGHALDEKYNKCPNREMSKALELLNSGPMIGSRQDIPKKYRGLILQIEKNGVKYMSRIHKMLDLEIPFYKVKHQQDIDLFDYKFLYRYGRFATKMEAYQMIYKKVGVYQRLYGKRSKYRV